MVSLLKPAQAEAGIKLVRLVVLKMLCCRLLMRPECPKQSSSSIQLLLYKPCYLPLSGRDKKFHIFGLSNPEKKAAKCRELSESAKGIKTTFGLFDGPEPCFWHAECRRL